MRALQEINTPRYLLRVIDGYLSDRLILYDSESGPRSYVVIVLHDGVLCLPLLQEVQIISLADVIAVTIIGKELTKIKHCSQSKN